MFIITKMISWLDAIDKSLFHFFNNTLSNTLFDILMPIITNQGYWAVPILILLLYLFVKGGKRGQVTACLLIITVVATDALLHRSLNLG